MFGFLRRKQRKAPAGVAEEEIDLSSRVDPHIATTFAEGSERLRREDLAPLADAVPVAGTSSPLVTRAASGAAAADAAAADDAEPEHPLVQLAHYVVARAIDGLAGGGAELVPFVVTEDTRGDRVLHRFARETLEDGQAAAREWCTQDVDSLRIGMAWDGYLTLDGERTDAIFVEVSERGQPQSVMYAQRYRPATAVVNLETVGEPRRVGTGDPLLR